MCWPKHKDVVYLPSDENGAGVVVVVTLETF